MDDRPTFKETEENISAVREDLISTAVKFLQNPNVQKSSVAQKEVFLRKKGLSEKEISLAFERSLLDLPLPAQTYPKQQQLQMNLPQHMAVPMPGYYLPQATTRWTRLREMLHNFAIVGGLIYGLYLLYKKYIAPFLFGVPSKHPAIEDSIQALHVSVTSSVQELREDLRKVQTDVDKIAEQQELNRNQATARQMQDLKSEVISLKGLLLNRKQFTSAPVERPSIPAWQLDSEQSIEQKGDEESGSVGSEAELATINGSDSSLEMIKE